MCVKQMVITSRNLFLVLLLLAPGNTFQVQVHSSLLRVKGGAGGGQEGQGASVTATLEGWRKAALVEIDTLDKDLKDREEEIVSLSSQVTSSVLPPLSLSLSPTPPPMPTTHSPSLPPCQRERGRRAQDRGWCGALPSTSALEQSR